MQVQNNHIIEIKNISLKMDQKYLLKNVNWQVKKGEHWVVFGMNGSGKTTLLSIIAGFGHFTSGEIAVLGKSLNENTILSLRKKIGFVSASFFDKHYTRESVLDVVLSGLSGTLCPDYNIVLKDVLLAKNLLRELNLGDKIDYPFDLLSKGQRQEVLIARALITKPEILILDEPCTGLDVYNRSYLFRTLEELNKKNKITIIYVTHYVEEIIDIFDNILLMKNGTVFKFGKTQDLLCKEILQDLLNYPVEISRENTGTYRLQINAVSKITDYLK